jgi:hypothetical protein
MWSLVERFKQRRARRKFMPEPRRRSTGTITKLAIVALVLILGAMAALQLRGGSDAAADLVESVKGSKESALDLIQRASAAHRLVFIADVPSASAPKELVASAIERLAKGTGLDVLALEIDASEQRYIDQYLATPTEDAALLLSRPRITHEEEGVSRSYLDVLHAVRRINDELGADRQIRIIALDRAGWPPVNAESPSDAARQFGQRDSAMYATIAPILDMDPKTRVLFFVGGLHALKGSTGIVQTGGTRTVQATWLASRLMREYPQDVYSILVDATPSRIPSTPVASYRGTAAGPVLRDAGVKAGSALAIDPSFEFSHQPITVVEKPGIHFEFSPHDLKFSDVADAYIYFGS